jgi:hypothetical protein
VPFLFVCQCSEPTLCHLVVICEAGEEHFKLRRGALMIGERIIHIHLKITGCAIRNARHISSPIPYYGISIFRDFVIAS